jgi:hypothetical protein
LFDRVIVDEPDVGMSVKVTHVHFRWDS